MAVYKIFPSQDSTIYSLYPTMNTGIDPIIEIMNHATFSDPTPLVSRFLIKFPTSQLNDIIENKIGNTSFNSNLKCFIANTQGIVMDSSLEIYPISGSWNNGSGEYSDIPNTTNGVSWEYQNSLNNNPWPTSGLNSYVTSSFPSNVEGGGVWFTGSNDPNNLNLTPTQSFSYRSQKDLNVDVTDIVKVWYSSSNSIGNFTDIQNEGLIIKWEDNIEFNSSNEVQPILQFYSIDTNTIYPPHLELKWDDQQFTTGSLIEINTPNLFIGLDNNPGTFHLDSINRFRLNVRETSPPRTFQTSSLYTTNKFLNDTSLYSLIDLDTNEVIIEFDDDYTKISCDEKGNYFDIYMGGLEPERYYKILIKTTINGSTIIKDDKYYFKVING